MNADINLVKNIIAGNKEDFRILIRHYKTLVSHIIFRLVDNKTDQEELGQEIFIKIYRNLPSFEFRSKLSTWIARIAYNTCLNFLRKKNVSPFEERLVNEDTIDDDTLTQAAHIDPLSHSSMQPDETMIKDQISLLLQQEIARLPIQYRKVITFYHLDNMNYQEIGEIMNLPMGTVKSYIFRARKLLKDRLLATYKQEELCW